MEGINLASRMGDWLQNTISLSLVIGFVAFMAFLLYKRGSLNLFSAFFGRALDDYQLAIHEQYDNNFFNKNLFLSSLRKKQNFLYFSGVVIGALVSPFISLVVVIRYLQISYLETISKMKEYAIFEINDNDDDLLITLNTKFDKVNTSLKYLEWFALISIALSVFTNNPFFINLSTGYFLLMGLLISIVGFNTYSYIANHKPSEFFQITRLLKNIFLVSIKNILKIGIVLYLLSLVNSTGFTYLLIGFGFYVLSALVFRIYIWVVYHKQLGNELDDNLVTRDYENLENFGSFANFKMQEKGYVWTSALDTKIFQIQKELNGKKLIKIDNFSFYPDMINKSMLRSNPLLTSKIKENIEVKLEALDFTKQMLLLGGMGSGKTEFLNNVLHQVHANKFDDFKLVIYNDFKGEFVEKFYREDKDIILNIFDSRAKVWDMFQEMEHNIEAGINFINNLFSAIVGNEKDFFNSRAKQLMSEWTKEAFFSCKSSVDRWDYLFSSIEDYKEALGDDKTKASIFATVEIALEVLEILKHQICVEKRETFSINEFLRSEDKQLFLLNTIQYADKLIPYLTGVWGAIVASGMSLSNTKEHLILNVIDEFLSMQMQEDTRLALLTATRSKGFCNILAMQFLKKDDEQILQLIDSSRYALVTFNINDDFTLEQVSKKISSVEFASSSSSASRGIGSSNSYNLQVEQKELVSIEQLQSMPMYHHLTFLPTAESIRVPSFMRYSYMKLFLFGYDKLMRNIANEKEFNISKTGILYLGYTPLVELNSNNSNFEKWDSDELFKLKMKKRKQVENDSENNDEKIQSQEMNLENFKEYLTLKFSDNLDWNENAKELFAVYEMNEEAIQKFNEIDPKTVSALYTKFMSLYKQEEFKELYDLCQSMGLMGAVNELFLKSN